MDRHCGEARATYVSFNAYQLQGALNLPIITDVLGLRLVGGYAKSDGYMRNGYCYGPVVTFGPSKYAGVSGRSAEHTPEPQSLMRISYAVFCLKKKNASTF